MTRIARVEEAEATGEAAEVYAEYKAASGRDFVPGILKCFSARPDFMRQVWEFARTLHFSDGHLTQAQKEMIATYVSALNHCEYCTNSHAGILTTQITRLFGEGPEHQAQGEQAVAALARGDLDAAPLSDADRELLRLMEKVTRHAYRTTDADIERLRGLGWTDPQIAEAIYVTAIFGFYNRVADAFGLSSQDVRRTAPPS